MKLIPSEIVVKTGGYMTLVFADKGAGKTTFMVDTADVAEPLFLANFDARDPAPLLRQYKGKELYYENFPAAGSKQDAVRNVERLLAFINTACKVGTGVFGIDNARAMHDTVKMAFLPEKPKDEKFYPKEYGDVNSYHNRVFATLEASQLWTIITAPADEIWQSQSQGTGLYTYKGWNELKYAATMIVYLFCPGLPMGVALVPNEANWPVKYRAQIFDSKVDRTAAGALLDNPRFADILEAGSLR